MNNDAKKIIDEALREALPDSAVEKALKDIHFDQGKVILISIGKAAWQMAKAAYDKLGERIATGAVVTKYGHSKGDIGKLEIFEAGHPVSDANTYLATQRCIELVSGLSKDDNVLLLISGGGSALFEKPLVTEEESQAITKQLLYCGADIVEMNTLRKRLSAVKGGRFAKLCQPAHVSSIILSDIIGDPLDMIASGPAYPDSSTTEQALKIIDKYSLYLSAKALECIKRPTPKSLDNVTSYITGSVKQLCSSAAKTAKSLGYEPIFLTSSLNCEARDAGLFLSAIARDNEDSGKKLAFIAGGETVVHITGKGKGGRNQEIALAAADGIRNIKKCCIFSVGSDGTDGPTDAAGGCVDQDTAAKLEEKGINIASVLKENDSYEALKAVDGLIFTGPTGTNVNDLTVLLLN